VGAGELLGSGSGVAWFEGHPGMLHAPILTNSNPSRKAILNLSTTMYYNPGVFGCQSWLVQQSGMLPCTEHLFYFIIVSPAWRGKEKYGTHRLAA
jgi:hypothetical protein